MADTNQQLAAYQEARRRFLEAYQQALATGLSAQQILSRLPHPLLALEQISGRK
jgi:hypothetical protein